MVDSEDRGPPWGRVPYLNPGFVRPAFADDLIDATFGRHCALVIHLHTGAAVAIGLRAADALELGELLIEYAKRELAGAAQQAAAAATATIHKASGQA